MDWVTVQLHSDSRNRVTGKALENFATLAIQGKYYRTKSIHARWPLFSLSSRGNERQNQAIKQLIKAQRTILISLMLFTSLACTVMICYRAPIFLFLCFSLYSIQSTIPRIFFSIICFTIIFLRIFNHVFWMSPTNMTSNRLYHN